ncbi:hemolysin secretion/activation protein, ShlB/FhaC/HecB family [Campylobacter pinnipediorum subsp. pinnipediorum]|uniref:Hemolysin secretion/activation protein, ShlB/FhaC/HecB family n=1 Tax=Campylobacter pinnipediorum subsp. pinnipediorum TaxID=1660067 RepID=A0AAX0L996_9BACT|nr:ShlB/FhaC/HecB family hemolysin secretion/activation protein [Campylobacter pinnipediorum]OPA76468.1 hemolysin secretion/activation protein, ShlB/FhaC/HecB family [Campylobacter pinnipediorum subsp. pinnipediorum]
MKNNFLIILSLFYITCLEARAYKSLDIRNEKIEENRQFKKEIDKEIQNIDNQKSDSIDIDYIKEENKINKIDIEKQDISLKKIFLDGEHPLKEKLQKEIKKFLNAEMNEKNIYLIIEYINKRLIEDGYVTSFSFFKNGNVYDGYLELEIKAGKINEIYFETKKDKGFRERQEIFFAFPYYKDKVLNTKYLDQGIENLSMGRKQNQLEIVPSDKEGYSDIIIHQKEGIGNFGINYDNSPIDKDRNKLGFNYNGGNIFPINDSFGISYSTNLGKDYTKNKDENLNLSYTIPFGYYKFSYNLGINKTHSVVKGNTTNITRDGKVKKQKFKLSRVITRGKYNKMTGYVFFSQRDNETYINNEKILINSKTYSTTGLGVDYSDKFLGGNIYLGLEYEKGVPWFKAEGDKNYNPKLPKKEFQKYSLNVDWGRYFLLQNKDVLGFRSSFLGVYSNDRLLNINKMSIGDDYTVRGFKQNSISGEKGAYISNTLTYYFSEEKHPYIHVINPFVGLDAGTLKDKDNSSRESIIGMAYGVKFQKNGFNGSLMVSRALKTESRHKNEGNVISFNFGHSF